MDSRKQSRQSDKPTVRLQKYLAGCGIGSRRTCERIIAEHRVEVDGKIIEKQGERIDPAKQTVCVDGRMVCPQHLQYILLNKPRGVICTSSDEKGRRTIHDLLPETGIRVYNVGRLDRDSEGLLLVTNDGELAARLMHPRYHISKTYRILVDRKISENEQQRMKKGMKCDADVLRIHEISFFGRNKDRFEYEIVLKEGKNRQIRRMIHALDMQVYRLQRIRMGSLTLDKLAQGQWRYLTNNEVITLKKIKND